MFRIDRLFQNPYMLIAPSFLLLIVFSYYPFFAALSYAFYRWPYLTQPPEFAGLDNFRKLFTDPHLWLAFRNMLVLTVADVLKVLVVTTLVAELIFSLRGARMAHAYRIMLVLPMVVPGIVMLYIWHSFYNLDNGLINNVLRLILGPDTPWAVSWLGNPNTALGAFVFMGFPWCGGIAVLIVLAGLYSIPQDIFDCAKVDGVGALRRVFTIDIYLIAGQLKLLVVLAILGSVQGFVGQMVLTDGGPARATLVPALHLIHHAFRYGDLGYGAAIAVLLFLIMLVLTVINLRYIRSSEEVV